MLVSFITMTEWSELRNQHWLIFPAVFFSCRIWLRILCCLWSSGHLGPFLGFPRLSWPGHLRIAGLYNESYGMCINVGLYDIFLWFTRVCGFGAQWSALFLKCSHHMLGHRMSTLLLMIFTLITQGGVCPFSILWIYYFFLSLIVSF